MRQSAQVSAEAQEIEREHRQLALMGERMEQFRRAVLPLSKLISDLEGLLEARTLASEQWVHDFRSACEDLEITYAVALDRLTAIPDAHDPTVADGLLDLDVLIRRAVQDLG